MDTVIQFTPAQLIAIAGAIITISTAIGVIINLISKAREPERKQDERIKALEDRADKHDAIIEKFQGYFDCEAKEQGTITWHNHSMPSM